MELPVRLVRPPLRLALTRSLSQPLTIACGRWTARTEANAWTTAGGDFQPTVSGRAAVLEGDSQAAFIGDDMVGPPLRDLLR